MSEPVIRVENLSKRYRIGGRSGYTSYGSLRESLANAAAAPFRRLRSLATGEPLPEPSMIWALKDVSFEVKSGETLGIIGRNGAGKSTLLKILSRITKPTSGRVRLRGRVGSLLEVGTGFHPELTGRENIFLNGAILGMTRREIEQKFDEIVAFAEIEPFLDTAVKFYSSGMYMRLAFSVAAHLEPEILLVDEVLAVGDHAFQKKCLGKMGEVAQEGRTVLFVSHNMGAVRSLCNSGINLDGGEIKFHGAITKCVDYYLNTSLSEQGAEVKFQNAPELGIQLSSISIVNPDDAVISQQQFDLPLFIKIKVKIHRRIDKHYLAVHIHDSDLNTLLFARDFESNQKYLLDREPGERIYYVEIPANVLVPGMYRVSVHLAHSSPPEIIQRADLICPFEIIDAGSVRASLGFPWLGKVAVPLRWKESL